jgi:hypothetical protein
MQDLEDMDVSIQGRTTKNTEHILSDKNIFCPTVPEDETCHAEAAFMLGYAKIGRLRLTGSLLQ